MNDMNETVRGETESGDYSMKHLTFQVDGQHYGIPISNVIEILQMQPATLIPELPAYSKGIINLRGRIVPLIDVNLRFGRHEKEYGDRACIIIVDIDSNHTGLIVDSVEDVLEIDDSLTAKPPEFSSDDSAKYVTSVARLEKNTALLLDVRQLLLKANM